MYDLLRDIYLFESLTEKEIEKFLTVTKTRSAKKDETLFKEGEPADTFYIIVDGKIRISKVVDGIGEEALAILEKGDYFGEMGLLDDSPRSATAIIHENSKLLIVTRQAFLQFLADNSKIAYKILLTFCKTLSERLRETNDKISNLFAISKRF